MAPGAALLPTPTRRYADMPLRLYGLPDGEATGEFCSDGVVVGLVSCFVAAVGDGTGVGVSAGVADATGVAEVFGVAEVWGMAGDCGVADVVGTPDGATVGIGAALVFGATVAAGAGFAFLISLSKRPTRLSALCLATKIVRRRVTPKSIPPRYTVALVRTVVV